MNNEYIARYAKWRTGVMPHDAKIIVRQSIMDNVDPEPLLLKYYQENVQSKPFSITDTLTIINHNHDITTYKL